MRPAVVLDLRNLRRWHLASLLNPCNCPRSVLGDQRLRTSCGAFERRQVGCIAHIAKGNTDITQEAAPLDSFYRRTSEQAPKFGIAESQIFSQRHARC